MLKSSLHFNWNVNKKFFWSWSVKYFSSVFENNEYNLFTITFANNSQYLLRNFLIDQQVDSHLQLIRNDADFKIPQYSTTHTQLFIRCVQ